MDKRFTIDKITTERVKTVFGYENRLSVTDINGRTFDDYLKIVPREKFYILYDKGTCRIMSSAIDDITLIPITAIKTGVLTWIDKPKDLMLTPFNRPNEKIDITQIVNLVSGNIFMSHTTDAIYHLDRFQKINEFGMIVEDLDKIKEQLLILINPSIYLASYIGFTHTDNNGNKYLQPYRSSDISDLQMLINLPQLINMDVKLYNYKMDGRKIIRDSSDYTKSTKTDDELNVLLATMFNKSMLEKHITNELTSYINSFTSGEDLREKFNLRIEDNNPVSDMYIYILNNYINK